MNMITAKLKTLQIQLSSRYNFETNLFIKTLELVLKTELEFSITSNDADNVWFNWLKASMIKEGISDLIIKKVVELDLPKNEEKEN